MSHTKLFAEESARKGRGGPEPRPVRSASGGPGNRDLLAELGTATAMPAPVQAKMEQSMGADFSRVSLFESPLVAEGGAEAAASGNRVAFAPGKLDFSSAAGLELLGHELSHVDAQARGKVPGRGLVNDPVQERKADADGARAARAFDSVSGGMISPMGVAPAPVSPAAPVQAKKKKENLTAGQRFQRGYNDLSLQDQVTAMRNMAITASADNDQDRTESRSYFHIARHVPPEFMEELLRQQVAAARDLNSVKQSYAMGGDMDDAQVDFMTKYSSQATLLQGFSTLAKDIGMRDNDAAFNHYLEQQRALKTDDPAAHADLGAAQSIVGSDNKKNVWAMEHGDAAEAARKASEARDLAFAREWQRPGQEKQGFFQRLFGRKKRGSAKWQPWA